MLFIATFSMPILFETFSAHAGGCDRRKLIYESVAIRAVQGCFTFNEGTRAMMLSRRKGYVKFVCRGFWLALFVCLMMANAVGGSAVYVGNQSSGRLSMDKIDHSAWDQLLQKYVDKNGRVNYQAFKASTTDHGALDRYLSQLSTASAATPASRNAQLAFWINAYNAVTVKGILREYPTSSIRNHTARLFGYNIWHDLQLYVGGKPYSLDQIEHQILRKLGEPRIHFAIVCASIGCPRLLDRAYVAGELDDQLEANAKDFFARRQNFVHDVRGGRFQISAILDWFGEDFGADQAAQLRKIAGWLPTDAARAAARGGNLPVSYLDYNWNLNSQ
jgi:hypothetical protein